MRVRRSVGLCILCGLWALMPGCLGQSLEISTLTLPRAAEDTAYSAILEASATVDLWAVVSGSLPPGLGLDVGTGAISGTPTAAGTYEFAIAAYSVGLPTRYGLRTFTITVAAKLMLGTTLDRARVAEAYSGTLATSGGVPPYTFDVLGLPAGMTFDASTGTISGTPLSASKGLDLLVTVTDSGEAQQTATAQLTLVIKPLAVSITTTNLPDGQINQQYSQQVQAANGFAPYTWSVSDGVLPDNLRLNLTTGVIAGIPIQEGSYTFTITVVDDDLPPSTDSQELTIVIQP